jgi:hypothetical protein
MIYSQRNTSEDSAKNKNKNKNKNKKSSSSSKTLKNKPKQFLASFQKGITIKFFEMLLLIKLFHWKTYSYSTHKATDQLYESLNKNMDRFMEVLLGKSQIRMNFKDQKSIPLMDVESQEKLSEKIHLFINYLVNLSSNKIMLLMNDTGLFNIRDEILEDMNQFLYLLSLK